MKKIISLFQRNYDSDRLVRNEVTPGAEWVVASEGVATRKYDGTCCLIRNHQLFKRYDCKRGKTPPLGWEAAQEPDPVTGHHPGWVPVGFGPDDKWHREAFQFQEDGTYELVGPKINGNQELFADHILVKHGQVILQDCPRTFEGLKNYLSEHDIEGVVWHHPDGRMVKIKGSDFGLKRPHPTLP